LFAESSVYSFMSIVTSVHLLLQQLVAKHVNQVIIDAKVGPPHFEEGMAAAIFSLIRETGCNNCIMWAKADKIVQEFMYLSQDPEVRLLMLSLTGCCSVEHMPYVYLTLVAGWMF
jgi:hypothetical protein